MKKNGLKKNGFIFRLMALVIAMAMSLSGCGMGQDDYIVSSHLEEVMVGSVGQVEENTLSEQEILEARFQFTETRREAGGSDLLAMEIAWLPVSEITYNAGKELEQYTYSRNNSIKTAYAYYYDIYYNSLNDEEKNIFRQITEQVTNEHPNACVETEAGYEAISRVVSVWPWSVAAAPVYELMQAQVGIIHDTASSKYYIQFFTRDCDDAVFEQKLDACVSNAMQYSDIYNREKAIHDWVVQNVTYDYAGMFDGVNQTAGSIAKGSSVCAGISKFISLANLRCGIHSNIVLTAEHAFNYIYIGDKVFLEDATWCLDGCSRYGWFLIGRRTRDILDDSNYYHTAYDLVIPPELSWDDFNPATDNVYMTEDSAQEDAAGQEDSQENAGTDAGDNQENENGAADNAADNNANENGAADSAADDNANENGAADSAADNNANENGAADSAADNNANENGAADSAADSNANENGAADSAVDNNANNDSASGNGNSNNNGADNANNSEEQKPVEDPKKLIGMSINHKSEYVFGDPIVDNDFYVQVHFNDGTRRKLDPSEYSIVGSTKDSTTQVTIYVYYQDFSSSFTASIRMPEAWISYDPSSMTCYCMVAPARGNECFSWSSSNTNAVTVDQNGKLNVVGGGQEATITCSYSFNGERFSTSAKVQTGYGAWGEWSGYGFDTLPSCDTREVENVTLYQYYFFYDNVGTHSPLWNTYRGAGYIPEDSYTVVYAPFSFDSCEGEWMEGWCFDARSYTGNAIMSNKQGGWESVYLQNCRIYAHESRSTIVASRYRDRGLVITRFE